MDKLTLSFKSGDTLYAADMNSVVGAINTLTSEVDSLKTSIQNGDNSSGGGSTSEFISEYPGSINNQNETSTDPDQGTPSSTPWQTTTGTSTTVTFDFNHAEAITFNEEVNVNKYATSIYESFVDKTATVGNVTLTFFRKHPTSQIGLYGLSAQTDSLDAVQALYLDRDTGFIVRVPKGNRITKLRFDGNYNTGYLPSGGFSTLYDKDNNSTFETTYFTTMSKTLIAVRSTNEVTLTYGTADGTSKLLYSLDVTYEPYDETATENIYPRESTIFNFNTPTVFSWSPKINVNTDNGGRTNIDGCEASLDNVHISFNKYQDSYPYIQCVNLPETDGPQFYLNPQSGSTFTISVSDNYIINSIVFDKYTSSAISSAIRIDDSMPQRAYGAGGVVSKNSDKQIAWIATTNNVHSVTFCAFDAGSINQYVNQIAVSCSRIR